MSLQIASPFQQFFDRDGSPLDNGFVYIGTANLNPETNPLTVYFDDALTIPAAQPLRTSSGYIVRNGSPARLYTSQEDFSLTVREKNGVLVYTVADATSMANLQTQLASGSGASLVGYNQGGVDAIDRTVQDRLRDFVTVNDFGAVGDGVADDTAAIQAALDVGGHVVMPKGTYLITDVLTVGTTTLDGMGSTINATGTNQIFTVAGGCVKNLTIDGQNAAHTAFPSEILASTGSTISNVTYQNFAGVLANFQTYCIKLPMWNVLDFEISRVTFKNITQQDNGAVVGAGFVGGIFFTSATLGTQADVTRGVVRDIYGQNVKSVNSGSGVVQDSDLIRSYYDNVDDLSALDWPIAFENITAKNVGKRVFKIGNMNGGSITNVVCIKDDAAAEAMYSAISINANRWEIDRVRVEGEVERGIELNGESIVVSDVVYSTTVSTGAEFAILLGSGVGSCSKCVVSNVVSSQAAAAIYFYDAFDCRVMNVFARGTTDSLAVRTFNASTGNINTISSVTTENAGLLVDGGAFLNVFDLNIQEHTLTSFPFSVVDGSVRARGVYIVSSTGRRIMNIAPLSGQSVDLDDVVLVRAADATSYSTNNYSIFTTVDANAGAFLRIGKMRVVSNHNPAGTPVSNAGRAHFRIESLNYIIDHLIVVNNFARGEVGQDIYINTSAGNCSVSTIQERQDIAGGNIIINAPSAGKLTIHDLELENAFSNPVAAYIGTVFARGGASVTGALNTPTTITV